jgi:hypothetical protein
MLRLEAMLCDSFETRTRQGLALGTTCEDGENRANLETQGLSLLAQLSFPERQLL